MKVNADFRLFAGINFDAAKYIPSPSFGVDRFMLDRRGTELARATTIVRYAPNSKFPQHMHIGGEEFLVLEGTFKDQFGEFPAGTYVRNPIGSEHAPWVDEDGCTIFVKLLQMAEIAGEDGRPLHVNLEMSKESDGITTEFGTLLHLYNNSQTGERVDMLWLHPNSFVPLDELCVNGGEELFVMTGSLTLDSRDEYNAWGWLRFPVGKDSKRPTLRAGSQGAQIYRKTGHLTDYALSLEKIKISED